MKTSRILITLIAVFLLLTFFCSSAIGDNTVLRGLKSVHLAVNTPQDSGTLSFRIRNRVELKLRQAGLDVRDNASTELHLNIICVNIDSENNEGDRIVGMFGTVQVSLYEPVFLGRDTKVQATACTWQGHSVYFYGPPDTFFDRAETLAVDLVDEFLNEWLKARQ